MLSHEENSPENIKRIFSKDFFVVTPGEDVDGLGVEARDAVKHPTRYKTAPTTITWLKMSVVPRSRNSDHSVKAAWYGSVTQNRVQDVWTHTDMIGFGHRC